MSDGRSKLGFYIIAYNGDILFFKPFRPFRIACNKNRHIIDKSHPCFKCTLGIKTYSFFGADREVIEEHICARILQFLNNICFCGFRLLADNKCIILPVVLHMVRDSVKCPAHFYFHTCEGDIRTKNRCAVRGGKYRL
ncbi:hypothetical protein DSECCO2_375750 [anaerobic digester metagenome]